MVAKPKIQRSLIDGFVKNVPDNEFLNRVAQMINFEKFRPLLDACYQRVGRAAYDPIVLFKMLLLQMWYRLSDREIVAEAADRLSFRHFLELDICDEMPDDTTLVRFRNRLGENGIFDKLMSIFDEQLIFHNIKIKGGRITIVDATLVQSYSRPKSDAPEFIELRDPGAQVTCRRGKDPLCGYKVHVAMDAKTRIIRQVELTGAAEMEVHHLLVPSGTTELLADKGYHSAENRLKLKESGVIDNIMIRASRGNPLTESQTEHNKNISPSRAKIESKFGEMKLWNRLKRGIYRGIERVWRQVIMTVMAVNIKRLLVICPSATG